MRGRGLKQEQLSCHNQLNQVAPHAGAWIETDAVSYVPTKEVVAPHAGAWIETVSLRPCSTTPPRRPPCGGVD